MVLLVPKVVAQAKFISAEGYEAQCGEILDPGKTWFDGYTMQIRGQVSEFKGIANNPLVGGTNTVTLNVTLDLTTGNGTAWGKFKSIPSARPYGSWEGSFSGRVVGGLYQGKGIGHGTGELSGMQMKNESLEMPYDSSVLPLPSECGTTNPSTMLMNDYRILMTPRN